MSKESITLLSTITALGAFTGTKQKGAGYHKYNDGVHTFSVSFKNWSGDLKIQGTLELYPSDNDSNWVTLIDTQGNPVIFGDGSTDYDDSYAITAIGKFAWIRATGLNTSGEITEIRYNY
jgi:hypothetical protein